MANSIQCFLKSSSENIHFLKLMETIRDEYSFYFEQISNSKCEFLTNLINSELIKHVSADSETTITFSYYDTAMGYAKKYVYSHGYKVSCKNAQFGMDLEILVNDNAVKNETSFDEELDKFIDLYGEETSNFPVKGDLVSINTSYCDDDHLLEWLDSQEKQLFTVTLVEPQSNGLWIEDCDYRIDFSLCAVVKASSKSEIDTDIDINNMYNFKNKIIEMFSKDSAKVEKFAVANSRLLTRIMDLSYDMSCESVRSDEEALLKIQELNNKLRYNIESFIKSTIDI